MGLLSLTSEELRYKMKHLNELCPNRSVANDNELFDVLNDKQLKQIEDKLINYYGFEVLD